MGSAILCCIEHARSQRPDGSWEDFGTFAERVFLGRDYGLFALMGGGRLAAQIEPVCEPRGLPADLSMSQRIDWALRIDDDLAAYEVEGYCSRADAERWARDGSSTIVAGEWVSDPDAYCESWLAASDLDEVLRRFRTLYDEDNPELAAIIAAMRVLDGGQDGRSRLVFYLRG